MMLAGKRGRRSMFAQPHALALSQQICIVCADSNQILAKLLLMFLVLTHCSMIADASLSEGFCS